VNRESRRLAGELRTVGASKEETAQLARAAERLGSLHIPGMSAAARQRIAARLPVDVELQDEPRRAITLRWAVAGSFAALVIVASAALLLMVTPQSTDHKEAPQAHEVTKPAAPPAPDEQLQQQVQQL
jgi:hypothetical protein